MKNNNQSKGRLCFSLFWEFFKMGLFTIGGGMAMLPLIQKTVVEDKKWLDEEETIDCIAVSQAMPGVIVVNCASYVGRRLCGMPGAIAATLGVIMPSFLIIIAIVNILDVISNNPVVKGAFTGIKAAVCALVVVTAIRLGKQILKEPVHWVLAVIAFVMIAVFDITAFWPIIIGGVTGVVYQMVKLKRGQKE